MDFMEKARRCREFIDALDEERRKIEVFQRELPLSLHLINQTIDSYKKLMVGDDALIASDEPPVMKEFIPLKPTADANCEENGLNDPKDNGIKLDWMNSSHLWTQESDQQPKQDRLEKPVAVRAKRSWGEDDQHIDKKNDENAEVPGSSEVLGSSSVEVAHSDQIDGNDGGSEEEGKDEKSQPRRKIRRCWSEELHNRFVQALQQLGGCHAATPKQIRDLMKEDGLTNDEVKSHLQKYRLHTRRTNPAAQNTGNNNVPAQFVVVSGIWIPQMQEFSVATTGNAASVHTPSVQKYNAPVVSFMSHEQGCRATETPIDPKLGA